MLYFGADREVFHLGADEFERFRELMIVRQDNRAAWVLTAVLIIASALRLYGLNSEGLWLDEAITWSRLKSGLRGMLTDWDSERQGPLYMLAMWGWSKLFGFGEIALRLPSVLFGVLGVWAVYLLGEKLFNHSAGLWGSSFAAVNPFLIHYSQEARPYTMWFWLSLLSIWYLLKVFEGEKGASRGYVASTLSALYTHPYGPFLLLLQLVVMAMSRAQARVRCAKPALLTLAAYVPMGIVFLRTFTIKVDRPDYAGAWITRPDSGTWLKYFERYLGSDWVSGLTIALMLMGSIWLWRRDESSRTGLRYCVVIFLAMFFVPWLISQWVPILFTRYTIVVVAALLLVVGAVVSRVSASWQLPAGFALLLILAIPLRTYYTSQNKDAWREAAAWLTPQVRAGDQFVLCSFLGEKPLHYYYSDLTLHKVITPHDSCEAIHSLPDSGIVWFVASRYNKTGPLIAQIYETLDSRCDCDEWFKPAELRGRNPLTQSAIDIEITRCRVKPMVIGEP